MATTVDPFFSKIGKYLGVPPNKIRLKQSKVFGDFTCVGPRPTLPSKFPDLPAEFDYCFTFVLKIEPPRALCDAYRQEYDQLKTQLAALIAAGAWDDVVTVAQRLSELERVIRNTCRYSERAITYCIFPV